MFHKPMLGRRAAPAGTERSGLPAACVKLIAGKREHFTGPMGQSRDSDLAVWAGETGPFFGHKTHYGVRGRLVRLA